MASQWAVKYPFSNFIVFMNMPPAPRSSTLFKLTSLVIVLVAFATRHVFADFDTFYVAGLAVAALWIMQAQETSPGSGWGWVRGLAGAAALPVHGLLLAGIVAGPAIFNKKEKEAQTPRFVSMPVKSAKPAGGCGSGGCGGSAGGCGGGASGGGCGSSAGGCGSGGACGGGKSATAASQQGAVQRSNAGMAPSQPRPGFFQVPQGLPANRTGNAPTAFTVTPQPAHPAQPGIAAAMARPNVQTFAPAPTPQVSSQTAVPVVNAAVPSTRLAAVPAPIPQANPPRPVAVVNATPAAPVPLVPPTKPAVAPAAVSPSATTEAPKPAEVSSVPPSK